MLMASGVNFGLRATIPHLSGVVIGHALMTLALGMGLSSLFARLSGAQLALKTIGVLYVLFLASKIATSTNRAGEDENQRLGTPFSFLHAVAFQWINPKAWTLTITALSLFSVTNSIGSVLLVTFAFAAVNLPCVTLWTLMGSQLSRFFETPTRLKYFNLAMASLLIISVVPVIIKA